MSEVIPAILPKDFSDLKDKIEEVAGRVPMVHIDVANATFTPNKSWPYIDQGDGEDFQKIILERGGLPCWEEVNFEAHLMVRSPQRIFEDWIRAGLDRIIVHLESFDSPGELKDFLNGARREFDGRMSFLGIEIGLALKLKTPLENLWPDALDADFVHLMSISEIGEQGHLFEPKIFDRIRELKEIYPEMIISVDGGISLENADDLFDLGVERLVVGSEIYQNNDPYILEEFLEIASRYN